MGVDASLSAASREEGIMHLSEIPAEFHGLIRFASYLIPAVIGLAIFAGQRLHAGADWQEYQQRRAELAGAQPLSQPSVTHQESLARLAIATATPQSGMRAAADCAAAPAALSGSAKEARAGRTHRTSPRAKRRREKVVA
jgi:hypothetical protein